MNLPGTKQAQRGSTFIVVLWIAFGLVALTLYFGQTMSFELRAADNRVCALAADQAIDGATRYASYVLASQLTNGYMPDPAYYLSEAVKIGESRFWFIGRDTNADSRPVEVSFGLIDEGSRINLNYAPSNMLVYVPSMTFDLTDAILDWRDTNGGNGEFQLYYGMHNPPYYNKSGPFESVDELRLVYGGDLEVLIGEDRNRNGVLDPGENDLNRDGRLNAGVLEYVTCWSREPNTYSNGTARINITSLTPASADLIALLQNSLGTTASERVLINLGLFSSGGGGNRPPGGPGGQAGGAAAASFTSPLQFFRRSGMTATEFAAVADALTVTNGAYIEGRINVNTASEAVLACLPGISEAPDLAATLIDYRIKNPTQLGSIGWVVEAIGQNNSTVLDQLEATDCITTRSYQFTADIAAVGPHGRGYRRVRCVFDTLEGKPRLIYRQDLTDLGWALGKETRKKLLAAKDELK